MATRSIAFVIGSALLMCSLVAAGQDATPRLLGDDGKPIEFDVVSIKPNHSGATEMSILSPPMTDSVTIKNMPPDQILQWAFGIFLPSQITGLPGWASNERYDITAKVGPADVAAFRKVTDPIQRAPMLQKILMDRFHLAFHYETRELPVYLLVVAKSGMRMTEIQPAIGPNGMKDGGGRQLGRGRIQSMGQPMKPLVNALTHELGRPVVDQTGLTGYYNFTLKWTPDEGLAPKGASPDDTAAPSIFTAVQEQLGLKLENGKAPIPVLVVDRLEQPSEN